jgi:hypothetical protein
VISQGNDLEGQILSIRADPSVSDKASAVGGGDHGIALSSDLMCVSILDGGRLSKNPACWSTSFRKRVVFWLSRKRIELMAQLVHAFAPAGESHGSRSSAPVRSERHRNPRREYRISGAHRRPLSTKGRCDEAHERNAFLPPPIQKAMPWTSFASPRATRVLGRPPLRVADNRPFHGSARRRVAESYSINLLVPVKRTLCGCDGFPASDGSRAALVHAAQESATHLLQLVSGTFLRGRKVSRPPC